MTEFKVGDKVRCIDIPGQDRKKFARHEYLTVSNADDNYIGILEFNDIMPSWYCHRFELVERAPLTIEEKKHLRREVDDWVDDCLESLSEMGNPNADMIEADEHEDKRREFDSIMRKREYVKRLKALREKPSPEIPEFWDGEHLTNAIDKTLNRAEHPQAMWSL